jgi:general L-amino acid transport system permease protein
MSEMESELSTSAFVRSELVPERAAPVRTTGFVGFLRTRLFNSPTNILITFVGLLLLWVTVVPALRFLLVDAVWTGKDRNACLAENVGHAVGACWPFIQAKFSQLIYGFYPEAERWRANLTFFLAAVLLLPLLIPRLPAKGLNAGLFFMAFPVVAFFLLHGGGLKGLGVSWSAALLTGLSDSIGDGGRKLAGMDTAVIGPLLWLLGKLLVLVGTVLSWLIWPLVWLRDQIEATSRPVWADFAATAAIVSLLLFLLNGGIRTGWRALIVSLVIFAGIGIVISAMGLDRGGLAVVEFWRGVPLIMVLFFATYMLPLFLPGNFSVDGLVRALIGIALFAGAYQAEVIRGGLQAIPRGQGEAASALGLTWGKTTGLIVMPQALRHVIPGLVNSFIALFKDTSLVSIVALFDLLGSLQAAFSDPVWSTPTTLFTGFAFIGMIYFVFCFGMSRYSLFVENRLNAHRRN